MSAWRIGTGSQQDTPKKAADIDLNKPVQVLSFVAEMVEDDAHKQAQTTLLVAIYHELLKITGDGE